MEVRQSPQRRPLFLDKESPVPIYKPAGNPNNYKNIAEIKSKQIVTFTCTAKNWEKNVNWRKVTDSFGLVSIGFAFDQSPIFVVPPEKYQEVCLSFTAGNYGVDTESDYGTQELRLIQVSNGCATYIFRADALYTNSQDGLVKFMRSKDRIKVGVDIETDARRIKKHHEIWRSSQPSNLYNKTMEVGGIIDLQNLSRALQIEKPPISLKSLVKKYLPEFNYEEGHHDSYTNPTTKQYIYAANDAVAPLKIYFKMFSRS